MTDDLGQRPAEAATAAPAADASPSRAAARRSDAGRARSRRARRRRRWRHALAALAGLMSVTVVVGVTAIYSYASYRVAQIHTTHLRHLKPQLHYADPFTVLIVGTDNRKGTHNEYGHQRIACNCSDTMILARVQPADQRVSLLSIPRDSYVHLTGLRTTGKLNAAFTRGADNLIDTIERDFGIPINHYVLVDLASFKRTVDALGGIDMKVPMPIRDKNAHLDIETTGCQRLTGDEALAVSRARELQYRQDGEWRYDPTWEYGRNRREQLFLKVLARAVLSRGLNDPVTANRVVGTFTDHGIETDSGIDIRTLATLAKQFAQFDPDGIASYTLPTRTQEHTPVWGDVEILKPHKDLATIAAWYGSSMPAAGVTLPAAGITKPVRPGPVTPATGDTSPPRASGQGSGSRHVPSPNRPQPWDPRGCSS